MDPAAAPPTIDYEGPNGMTSVRNVMLRYTLDLSKHWQVALAAEAPSVTYTLSDGNNMAIRYSVLCPVWLERREQSYTSFWSYTRFVLSGFDGLSK